MSSGYATKEARYATRLGKQSRDQVNLCGECGREISGNDLLCNKCRGTLAPSSGGLSERPWAEREINGVIR